MILVNLLQIILSIILVIILALIAYVIFSYESISAVQNIATLKKEIIIFDGIIDFSTTQTTYNTYNKTSLSYRDLSPSVNQNGGAEYSYNFWLYIDKNSLTNNSISEDIVLLLRGSRIKLPYISDYNCEIFNKNKYIIVKNPLIRIKNDGSALIVEYNTITNPDSYRDNGYSLSSCGSSSWYDRNKGLLGIYNMDGDVYNKKWFMVTVILRETSPENDILYKNRTTCKIYINAVNILDRVVDSPYNGDLEGSAVMKHNKGPLYINPGDIYNMDESKSTTNPLESSTDKPPLLMANLSYFNYAIQDLDIKALFKKGFTKTSAELPSIIDNNDMVEDKYAIAPVIEDGRNLPVGF